MRRRRQLAGCFFLDLLCPRTPKLMLFGSFWRFSATFRKDLQPQTVGHQNKYFVIFLSFFCHFFVIFLSFFCHFVICLSFVCVFFVIFVIFLAFFVILVVVPCFAMCLFDLFFSFASCLSLPAAGSRLSESCEGIWV